MWQGTTLAGADGRVGNAGDIQAQFSNIPASLGHREAPRRQLHQHQGPVALHVVGEERRPLTTACRMFVLDHGIRREDHVPPMHPQAP